MFTDNLVFMYGVIIASEQLIEEALTEKMPDALHDYYLKHLAEERNHASWLLDDLKSVGVTPGLDWDATKLVGMQYYLIKHVSPDALLGYMLALEGKPMPLKLVAELETRHGKKLLRTLRYHAEHDVQHSSDLYEFIETTPGLNFDLILANIEQTSFMLNKSFNRIIREAA